MGDKKDKGSRNAQKLINRQNRLKAYEAILSPGQKSVEPESHDIDKVLFTDPNLEFKKINSPSMSLAEKRI